MDCHRLLDHKDICTKVYKNLNDSREGYRETINFSQIDERVELNQVGKKNQQNTFYEPKIAGSSFQKDKHLKALSHIKNNWGKFTWCLKGEIIHVNESLDETILMNNLSKNINDQQLLKINEIKNAMPNYYYNRIPHSRTLNPIFFLHEFDAFIKSEIGKINKPFDYVRYGNHFVLGFSSSKQDVKKIFEKIIHFINEYLKLQLCEKHSGINHLEKRTPFLGYHFKKVNKRSHSKRNPKTSNESEIKLEIPREMMQKFIKAQGYGNLDNFTSTERKYLVNETELTILKTYNRELRMFYRYYKLADNVNELKKVFHLAESSFIKTLAYKRRSRVKRVAISLRRARQGFLSIAIKDQNGHIQLYSFVKLKELVHGD